MTAKNVMRSIGRRAGQEYFYHRKKGYKLFRVSDGVDLDSEAEVIADFRRNCHNHVKQEPEAETVKERRRVLAKRLLKKAIGRSQRRARALSIPFSLDANTLADLMEEQDYRCAVTGLSFKTDPGRVGRSNPYRPSIDRIDNSKGYVHDNIEIVLVGVNIGKSDFGEKDYIAICRAVARSAAALSAKRMKKCKTTDI